MAANRSLTEPQIVDLAAALTMRDMKTIAGKYLGISPEFLINLEDTTGKDSHAFVREIIRHWRNSAYKVDQVLTFASYLYNALDLRLVSFDPEKIDRILGVTRQQVQIGQTQAVGATGGPVIGGIQPYVASYYRPSLTSGMLQKLSERLTDQSKITKLFISGLNMEDYEVEDHIQRNVSKGFTVAAHELLKAWRVKCNVDDQKAYEILCNALDAVQMSFFKQVLN